jgi:hypothetical protein
MPKPETKRDIRQNFFNRDQLMLFQRINNVRSLIKVQQQSPSRSQISIKKHASDRYNEIEKENRRLITRISKILHRK